MSVITTQVQSDSSFAFAQDPEHAVERLFVYPFHAAPTADLVAELAGAVEAGVTPAAIVDILLALPAPGGRWADLPDGAGDAAFCAALVDSYCHGTGIDAAVRAGWVQDLLPVLAASATRGAFVEFVNDLIDGYAGAQAEALELKAALAERLQLAREFRATPAGAQYDGGGWTELRDPLDPPPPPPPTYSLAAGAASVDEGASVTFTLTTTQLAEGTRLPYTIGGIGAADLAGDALSGEFVVAADGSAGITLALRADALSEGRETLTVTLDGDLASASVTVNDTSVTPPPPPTYAVTVSASSVNEGDTVTFTLTTTQLSPGTRVAYTLSGSGISAADVGSGQLTGSFTVDGDGVDIVEVAVVADARTEGDEVLRLKLNGLPAQAETTLVDTSLTPDPVGRPDTVTIAEAMNNSNARVPADAREGEIGIETYLTYDLLKQTTTTAVHMSLAQLRATSQTAGAPLDTTNRSADRGNIPQVSNQSLFTFDLGLGVDRVDYSAESGTIIAVISADVPAAVQHVIVNDDASDGVYNNRTDRVDTLIGVEEVVASRGGGVLDLTPSRQSWELRYSHQFDGAADVAAGLDRAVHTLQLTTLDGNGVHGRSYLEYRDAGLGAVTQAGALWSTVHGSDAAESVIFSPFEATDGYTLVLRGGDNAVKYNELTRSIVVDAAIVPWSPSTSLADDTNASGKVTVTTQFTDGDGVTLLSAATHVASSNGPDNRVAAGSLLISATQDDRDAISFAGTPGNKVVAIIDSGDVSHTTVRLASGPAGAALDMTGFEFIHDNGASDDLYIIDNIVGVAGDDPALVDDGPDHDAIGLTDAALGTILVGGAGTISLTTLDSGAGLGFDFDVLDLTRLGAGTPLTVTGTTGSDDELVLGNPARVGAVTLFESLVLTAGTLAAGSSYVLDLDAGRIAVGTSPLFTYGGTLLSAGGLAFGGAGLVAALDGAVTLRISDSTTGAGGTLLGGNGNDTLRGDRGDDTLRGGGGNDSLEGGSGNDVFVFEASGAANGSDTIDRFVPGSDKLDVTAFTGGAITAASASIDGQLGGTLAGLATTAEFIFNQTSGQLGRADFVTSPSAGQFVLADNTRCVIAITADPTGALGNAAKTPIGLYYVVNGSEPGLSDLSISLVATINGDDELTLADVFAGLS